jgi:hypothetical protein
MFIQQRQPAWRYISITFASCSWHSGEIGVEVERQMRRAPQIPPGQLQSLPQIHSSGCVFSVDSKIFAC